jgi:hypothetical protein
MIMSYDIDITRLHVDYRDADSEWMEGDYREIAPAEHSTLTMDTDDLEIHGQPFEWAVSEISKTDVTDASLSPVGDVVPEHCWLSGSYADPYTGAETETSVRLTGDWTPAERALVFQLTTSN